MALSWKLTSNTDEQNTLLQGGDIIYGIDLFVCSCGHFEFIIRHKTDVTEYFCQECENDIFHNANEAHINIGFFLSNMKNIDELLTMTLEKKDNKTSVLCHFDLPYEFNFSQEKIKKRKLCVYKLCICDDGKISKEYLNTPTLEFSKKMTKKLYPYIIKNRKITSGYSSTKAIVDTIDNEFRINCHLNDFELLSWGRGRSVNFDYTISDAFQYILNNRNEKSVQKALFSSYLNIIEKKNFFNPTYSFVFCKYIKDPNILSSLLDLELQINLETHLDLELQINLETHYFESSEKMHDNSLEIFIQFLQKYYSEANIYNILKNETYQCLLEDTIKEVLFYKENNLDTFKKTKSNLMHLHNGIVNANEKYRLAKIFNMEFKYGNEEKDRCITIDNYCVVLPKNGLELSEYSQELGNCMASYANRIKEGMTCIYLFLKNNQSKFAVEILNGELFQASTKYNGSLDIEDNIALKSWQKKFEISEF